MEQTRNENQEHINLLAFINALKNISYMYNKVL